MRAPRGSQRRHQDNARWPRAPDLGIIHRVVGTRRSGGLVGRRCRACLAGGVLRAIRKAAVPRAFFVLQEHVEMCAVKSVSAAVALAVGCLVAAGCYYSDGHVGLFVPPPSAVAISGPGGELIVGSEPPPPYYEAVPVSPGPGHVWIGGYWRWSARSWIWIGGTWAARPHPRAVWVAPVWVHHGHGWAFRRGHWR